MDLGLEVLLTRKRGKKLKLSKMYKIFLADSSRKYSRNFVCNISYSLQNIYIIFFPAFLSLL